ncbi:MAG: hypothetical protein PHT62_03660 [Desulfotomaculaceae bacterium]|nr:hypothetical protein [Desulfotomaculaceae bacterium]
MLKRISSNWLAASLWSVGTTKRHFRKRLQQRVLYQASSNLGSIATLPVLSIYVE